MICGNENSNAHTKHRIEESTRMIELFSEWYEEMRHVDIEKLERLLKLGSAAQKVLKFAPKAKGRAANNKGKS